MKKILASFAIVLLSSPCFSQNTSHKQSLGGSFIFNDFTSPERIRNTSTASVFNNKQWADFKDMGVGLALTYYRDLHPNIDLAVSLGGSSVRNSIIGKTDPDKKLLLEADASAMFKMFTDDYWVSPYFLAGVGASRYASRYGAILPIGGGVRLNFTKAFLTLGTQYRIPVTEGTNNYHFMYHIGIAGTFGK